MNNDEHDTIAQHRVGDVEDSIRQGDSGQTDAGAPGHCQHMLSSARAGDARRPKTLHDERTMSTQDHRRVLGELRTATADMVKFNPMREIAMEVTRTRGGRAPWQTPTTAHNGRTPRATKTTS